MPVFPLVGSMIVLFGVSRPSRSAASIIARAMRSLTDHNGLKLSSLATTVALAPLAMRCSFTSGVLPMH